MSKIYQLDPRNSFKKIRKLGQIPDICWRTKYLQKRKFQKIVSLIMYNSWILINFDINHFDCKNLLNCIYFDLRLFIPDDASYSENVRILIKV